jgi:hypothetical protein
MTFAYVSFVNFNENYINLMKITIESIETFSTKQLILYCIDFPNYFHIDNNIQKIFSNEKNQVIFRFINNMNLPIVYYYKPFIIIDAIKKGLNYGYYIESDDVMTPFADDILETKSHKLNQFPISPIHPVDVEIPKENYDIIGIQIKTNHYIHAHVLFCKNNLPFLEEWYENCLKSTNFKNADETVLNLMYWKYKLSNYHLGIIDPWYENFYTNPSYREKICSYHGCKDVIIQKKLLEDMKICFLKKNI